MNPIDTAGFLEPTAADQRLDEIASVVYSGLVRSGIEMTQDPDATNQLRQQIRGILDEVKASLRADGADSVATQRALSLAIGRSRARQAVHPSASLEAASRIFEIALPLLIADLDDCANVADPATAVSRALHRAIMARVAPAAVGYVEILLEKLAIAQHEERLRLSRDLHDHVAHNVAAAIQRIVLTRSAGVAIESTEYLSTAERLLRSALADTRTIGVELRQTVGDRFLDEAVQDYVDGNPTLRSLVGVHVTGAPVRMSTSSAEEMYVIIREALRNAITHAQARSVSVQFTWSERALRIVVVDDGGGFRLDNRPSTSMGLLAMRERAEAIGADLTVTSLLGRGTTIVIDLNLEWDYQ